MINLKNIHESKRLQEVLVGIALVVSTLLILFVGISIGERRADFAGRFSENYERNFMGPKGGMMGGINTRAPGGHGVVGEVININLPEIITNGPDNLEKIVSLSTSTIIRKFMNNVSPSEIKVGDYVVILGNPNDQGKIEAKLIRIMPAPYEK